LRVASLNFDLIIFKDFIASKINQNKKISCIKIEIFVLNIKEEVPPKLLLLYLEQKITIIN
jgi:hypothetical protein